MGDYFLCFNLGDYFLCFNLEFDLLDSKVQEQLNDFHSTILDVEEELDDMGITDWSIVTNSQCYDLFKLFPDKFKEKITNEFGIYTDDNDKEITVHNRHYDNTHIKDIMFIDNKTDTLIEDINIKVPDIEFIHVIKAINEYYRKKELKRNR